MFVVVVVVAFVVVVVVVVVVPLVLCIPIHVTNINAQTILKKNIKQELQVCCIWTSTPLRNRVQA